MPSIPTEILIQIVSHLTPNPPPFYFDRPSPFFTFTSLLLRETLISLCLVNKTFYAIASERLKRAPKFLREDEEKRLVKKLQERQKENCDHNDIEIRELYVDLGPAEEGRVSYKLSQRWNDRYDTVFTLLKLTRSSLTSLRLDALNNRYVREVLDILSSPSSSNSSPGSLKSLALSGDPYTITFAYLAHRFNRPYFLGLKELKLADVKVPEFWKWEEVEDGIPKYRLQKFEAWGGRWELEGLKGIIGLQGTEIDEYVEEERAKEEFEANSKPIEEKPQDEDDDWVDISPQSVVSPPPPSKPSSGHSPTSIRHLTLSFTHSACAPLSSDFSVLTLTRRSLVSLSISLQSPIPSFLSSFSHCLKTLKSLRSLALLLNHFPKPEETENPWIEKEVLKKLVLMRVVVEDWRFSVTNREGMMKEMKRWKEVMGNGRVMLEEGFEWSDGNVIEI